MHTRLLGTLTAALLAVSFGFADQIHKIIIPVDKTAPNHGAEMFKSYCAPCHGADGRGAGPAASALKARPTDLTALMRSNHGKFPETHIVTVLQFGIEEPAHGSATMPVWGPILGNMNRTNLQDKQLRISNLTRYLETIQEQ
ncbi:MAG TPA: c-type cytochrome [Terracidiphilus sp.]|nr:c-type cytochrome [Terracidiphilus sp.]